MNRAHHEYGRIWSTPEGVHIDVRGLEPPQPMRAILRLLDLGEVESVAIVHLDREPIFLYPELDERGWNHEVVRFGDARDGDEVVLRLSRCNS